MGKSRYLLSASATLAFLPLLVLLPGCSGGGGLGGFNSPTSTPAPTATATPIAIPNAAALNRAILALGNGQTGTLNLTQNGNAVSGTLTVNAIMLVKRALVKRAAAATSFTIPAGSYPVSGTFSPPRGVTLTGTFPAPIGAFSLSATVPTTTQTGSYSVTVGGQTFTGTLPVLTTPTPTASATATATATPSGSPTAVPTSGGTHTANLEFNNRIAINAQDALQLFMGPNQTDTSRSLAISFHTARTIGNTQNASGPYIAATASVAGVTYTEGTKSWQAASGTVKLTKYHSGIVTTSFPGQLEFQLTSVRMVPVTASGATGEFVINKTYAANVGNV